MSHHDYNVIMMKNVDQPHHHHTRLFLILCINPIININLILKCPRRGRYLVKQVHHVSSPPGSYISPFLRYFVEMNMIVNPTDVHGAKIC